MSSNYSKTAILWSLSLLVAVVMVVMSLIAIATAERSAAIKDAKNVQIALASYESEWETLPIGQFDGSDLGYLLVDPSGNQYLSPAAADDRQGWYKYPTDRNNGYEACLRYDYGTYNLMVTSEKISVISADSADMLEMINAMDAFATSLRWMSRRYDIELPTSLTDIDYRMMADEAHDYFRKEVDIFFDALEKYGYSFHEYYRSDFSDAPSTFHLVVESINGTYLMTNNQGTGVCGKALPHTLCQTND